jgi:hypothetical protein
MTIEIATEFANVAGPIVQFAKDAAFIASGVTFMASVAFVGSLFLTKEGKKTRKALRKTFQEFRRDLRQTSNTQVSRGVPSASRHP